jgi:hypothetical protein
MMINWIYLNIYLNTEVTVLKSDILDNWRRGSVIIFDEKLIIWEIKHWACLY